MKREVNLSEQSEQGWALKVQQVNMARDQQDLPPMTFEQLFQEMVENIGLQASVQETRRLFNETVEKLRRSGDHIQVQVRQIVDGESK